MSAPNKPSPPNRPGAIPRMYARNAVLGALCAIMSANAPAAVLIVPDDYPTIQAAINAAQPAALPADEVHVKPGSYNEAIDLLGKAIVLKGTGGSGVTTIDATGIQASVITCSSGESSSTVIEGFTITRGTGTPGAFSVYYGGGMYCFASSPTVRDCVFFDNEFGGLGVALRGAGMYATDGSHPIIQKCSFIDNGTFFGFGSYGGAGMELAAGSNAVITNCLFDNNDVGHGGVAGGLAISSSTPTITGCTFRRGSGFEGVGAIDFSDASAVVRDCLFEQNGGDSAGAFMIWDSSSPLIENCSFTGNSGYIGPGAIENRGSPTIIGCSFSENLPIGGGGAIRTLAGTPLIEDCTFLNNGHPPLENGGAISVLGGAVTIKGSTFERNEAGDGGAVQIRQAAAALENCVFRENSARWGGGAIYCVESSPTLVNCLFDGNDAERGGGIRNVDASPVVVNCTFVRNTAFLGGSAVYSAGASSPVVRNSISWLNQAVDTVDFSSASTTFQYCNLQTLQPGDGNISADPLFINPGAGDWRLQSGSPSIDAGHDWYLPADEHDLDADSDVKELIPVDLDGNPRFAEDPATTDTGCGSAVLVDMGVYEFQGLPLQPMKLGDIDGSGSVGFLDLLTLLDSFNSCTTGCCPADLNLDGVVSFADLLILLDRWG